MYGRLLPEFQTVGHSIDTLLVIIRGTFDFWPMLDHRPAFSHFYLYSSYTFAYGIMIDLVTAILNNTYRTTKSQMYYKSTLEMQDYEMIDFMMKRFKLWAGFQKPKPVSSFLYELHYPLHGIKYVCFFHVTWNLTGIYRTTSIDLFR